MSTVDSVPAPRVLPACDHCHAKKTRCDRQDPCGNCVTGKLTCLRRRPRQVSQNKNNESLDAVLERMSRLEETIKMSSASAKTVSPARRSSTATTVPSEIFSQVSDMAHMGTPESRQVCETIGYPAQRKRQEPSPSSPSEGSPKDQHQPQKKRSRKGNDEEEGQSPEDKMLANLDLKRYLRLDPQNCDIDKERQSVIESAILLAKSVAMAEPQLKLNRECRPNFYNPSMYPSAEFLHLLLHESSKSSTLSYSLVHFSTISQPLIEEMTFSLINCTVHGQKRIQYLICVNHVAHAFLMAFSSAASRGMRQQLRHSQQKYRDNMMTTIAHLDTEVRPDRTLMYALQSAAMLMQETGRMRQCWRFNSLACQVGAIITQNPSATGDTESADEIKLLRITCIRAYAFNSALSANIYQPACSAKLDIDRSVLDTENPEDAVLETLLSFAEVQEVIIQETKSCTSHQQRYQMNIERVASLKHQMRKIRLKIEEYRAESRSATDDFLQFEWLTIDFVFYSMMTSIIRLGATANDSHAHFSCLENARKCLFTLKNLLESLDQCANPDLYACSLAWVIPLFPLRPLYFVFTNVVATSDALDLKILQDVAKGLSRRIDTNPSIFEIHRLSVSLIDLYTSYADRVMHSLETQRPHMATPSTPGQNQVAGKDPEPRHHRPIPSSLLFGSQLDNELVGEVSRVDTPFNSAENQPHEMPPWDASFFEQQIDWDLFCAQPIRNIFQ